MEFKKYSLGDLGEICMCKRIMKAETTERGDVPFYKIGTFGGTPDVYISKELYEEYKKNYSYPKKGDVLISAAGTIGRAVTYNGEDAYYQDSNIVWINNDETKVLNSYLFYLYKNIRWKISTGSTILRLYNDNIRETEVIVPNLQSQANISKVLSLIDSKINFNISMNAELEAIAKQLYDYWFVQFDFPDENGKPYKFSGGKMVYNEKLKREIPEDWDVKTLAEVLGDDVSGDWGQDEEKGNYKLKVNCIRGADLKDPFNAPLRFISSKNINRILKQGNIIVEISGGSPVQATGRSLYVTKGLLERYNGSLICSNFCRALVLKDILMSHYFYYTWNLLYDNGVMFNFEGKTSGIKNLLLDMFVGSSWYFPPQHLYKAYATIIDNINNKIDSNKIQNQELTHLRDSLLPMLMNGQVIVE